MNHTLKVSIIRGLTMPPLTEAQKIARKERFAKSRERGLAWKAKTIELNAVIQNYLNERPGDAAKFTVQYNTPESDVAEV